MIALQRWELNSTRSWDLGNDIIAELQVMREINPDELERLEPIFDPLAFQ